MKNNLFDMLMTFFEKSLPQIADFEQDPLVVRPAEDTSIRVFTVDEQRKFTKASYQFIMRLMRMGVIATENMELIINRLLFSDSRYVTLFETKSTVRDILSEQLDTGQLAFLDLVLYQKEDGLPVH